MGKDRFSSHTRRFAGLPQCPCLYAAELQQPHGVLLKVGVGGNALGRMMSLQSEVKREHGADLGRFAIFSALTVKSAYEAEARAVQALNLLASPIPGRREFFEHLSFDQACGVLSLVMGAGREAARIWPELAEPSKEAGHA